MNVRELIDLLEEQAADLGDDAKVRIAYQPNYPLAAGVYGVTGSEDTEDDERGPVVWVAASASVPYDENPYAPQDAWS